MNRSPLPTVALALVLAAAANAQPADDAQTTGLDVRPDGSIPGWDHTPFAGDNASIIDVREGYTIANDYAPIDFPGIGRVPSPGGEAGERYDLEELHIRRNGSTLQVMLVASSPFRVDGRWLLGDLFLRGGEVRRAVATQDGGRGVEPGAVFPADRDDALVPLQPGEGGFAGDPTPMANDFGGDASVARIAAPWRFDATRVKTEPIAHATIQTTRHDFGGREDGTFLIQFTIDLEAVGLADHRTITARIAWGRGSDVIEAGIGGPSLLNQADDAEALRTLDAGGGIARIGRPAPAARGIPGGGGFAGGAGGASPRDLPAQTVPEPASALLMILGAILFTRRPAPAH